MSLAIKTAFSLDDFQLALGLASNGWQDDVDSFAVERVAALTALGRFAEARSQEPRGYNGLELGVLDSNPGNNEQRLFRIGALAREGLFDEAERELEEKIPESATKAPHIHRLTLWAQGEIALARGATEQARALFLGAAPEKEEIETIETSWWAGFLIQRAGRALCEAGQYEEAQRWLRRFLDEPEAWILRFSNVPVPGIRAYYDLAVCRNRQGDPDGALEYLKKFLEHWHEPDGAFSEIQDALSMYESLTGDTYLPEDD